MAETTPKKWYASKTIWVNFVAFVASLSLNLWGFNISADTQITVLAVINFILRFITKEEIVW